MISVLIRNKIHNNINMFFLKYINQLSLETVIVFMVIYLKND